MWIIWVFIGLGVFALVGAISSHSETVAATAKKETSTRVLQQRCLAYGEYIRRTLGPAGLGALGPTELLTHIETAAMRALAARKEMQDATNGMTAIGVIATIVALFWGASKDNAGVALPVAILCGIAVAAVSTHAKRDLAEKEAALAAEFDLELPRLQALVEGVAP